MDLRSPRWKQITPSPHPWEREGLDLLREGIPDHDPYAVWANFEFVAEDGAIYEIDALVLCPRGLVMIELKGRPGQLRGDRGTWSWKRPDGRTRHEDNPLVVTNRKAKKLRSLLDHQRSMRGRAVPYVQACVFLSDASLDVLLDPQGRDHVYARDAKRQGGVLPGIHDAVVGADPRRPSKVDAATAKAVARALEEAGIRPSQLHRRVGEYLLGAPLAEGPGYQDFEARNTALRHPDVRRIRRYSMLTTASEEERETVRRAAEREYELLQGLQHPGILRPLDYREHELGAALVYDYDAEAKRLDHFLADHSEKLDVSARLDIVRQLAEALRYAHEHRVSHRSLSPESVLVANGEDETLAVKILNWQTGERAPGTESSSGVSATEHLERLVDDTAAAYLAPESLGGASVARGASLDVFSLGALAYLLFTGKAPAESFVELTDRLRDTDGLDVSAHLNGAPGALRDLVREATCPEVSRRLESVEDVLLWLDELEEQLTDPHDGAPLDPARTTVGDVLEGGLVVKHRLGAGSTAVALLVDGPAGEAVLKLASQRDHNSRLRAEGEVLRKLRHPGIVELFGAVEIRGHIGLLMRQAGSESLARTLRREGRLSLDLLQRFGEDLLEVIVHLEHEGIAHRDVKPDNIGVAARGKDERRHLVLFDFSLSRANPDAIDVGTRRYLDPFLADPGRRRWDLYAERFALAMTLHEMATGTLPRWGDGQSHPAVVEGEVTLDQELFDPSVAEALGEFFAAALSRSTEHRFDTADDMLRAWRMIFAGADRPLIGDGADGDVDLRPLVAEAGRDTRPAELGLSPRALDALDRANVTTVTELLLLPAAVITMMRGVGNATRREIADVLYLLRERFPEVVPVESAAAGHEGQDGVSDDEQPDVRSLDLLAAQILPERAARDPHDGLLRQQLLGLEDAIPGEVRLVWPSAEEIAGATKRPRVAIDQLLERERGRWLRVPSLTRLRDEIVEVIRGRGGVVTAEELAETLLSVRGSVASGDLRRRRAIAVAFAAVEAELARGGSRLAVLRRDDERRLIALDLKEGQGQALLRYARELGERADELAALDPLPGPGRAIEELRALEPPDAATPLSESRLLALAASASSQAGLSSRLELYPRGLPAARALRLAQGALIGAERLTVNDVRGRVSARYPDSKPLPERPVLDDLLQDLGLGLVWAPETADAGAYRFAGAAAELTSLTATPRRLPTAATSVSIDDDPDRQAAGALEQRLQRATEPASYLVLSSTEQEFAAAEEELARRFSPTVLSFDELLLTRLRTEAEARGVSWEKVLSADAAPSGTRDAQRLLILVRKAIESVESDVASTPGLVLAKHLGLLARYGELQRLDRLRRRVIDGSDALKALWVLVPVPASESLPSVDGQAVSIVTPVEWAQVTEAWVRNAHRAASAALAGGAA